MTPSRRIEPGPHWWEASALTTAPSRTPLGTPDFLLGAIVGPHARSRWARKVEVAPVMYG